MAYRRIQWVCDFCATPFQVRIDKIREGKGCYCSMSCGQRARHPDALTRFFQRVQCTPGCWLWQGGKVLSRADTYYGSFFYEKRNVLAHRWIFEQLHGTLPSSLLVCHTCDTPLCVNPFHLFSGTHRENMRDAVQKDRIRHGERHGIAVLSLAQVHDIRAAEGVSYAELGRRYGVSPSTITHIRHRVTWRHLP